MLCACSSLPANTADKAIMDASDVAKAPKAYDGKVVSIRGFIVMDLMEVPSLYLSAEDATAHNEKNAIDLIPSNDAIAEKIKFASATCVIAGGTFETYDHGHITTGLVSDYGGLKVSSVKPCDNKR
jgi:hypothetical protein